MDNRVITITLSLLVLGVFAVSLIFFQSFRVQLAASGASTHGGLFGADTSGAEKDIVVPPKDPLVALYTFADDTYTVRGAVEVPHSCIALTSEARVLESYPERVTIRLTTRDEEAEGVVCEQASTTRSFRVIFDASEKAVITATLDRVPVELDLQKDTEGEISSEG